MWRNDPELLFPRSSIRSNRVRLDHGLRRIYLCLRNPFEQRSGGLPEDSSPQSFRTKFGWFARRLVFAILLNSVQLVCRKTSPRSELFVFVSSFRLFVSSFLRLFVSSSLRAELFISVEWVFVSGEKPVKSSARLLIY